MQIPFSFDKKKREERCDGEKSQSCFLALENDYSENGFNRQDVNTPRTLMNGFISLHLCMLLFILLILHAELYLFCSHYPSQWNAVHIYTYTAKTYFVAE